MMVSILGSAYTISFETEKTDDYLKDRDGYCDRTSKKIVVISEPDDSCELDLFSVYKKKVLRHEIIHAFLHESGLSENFKHDKFGHDETYVDWIAIQFPKILKAFQEAGAL